MTDELTFFECFAGVGGMSMGFELAGWRCVGHAEIEAFPRRVLAARWPCVPLKGDVTALSFYEEYPNSRGEPLFDLLSGGSPCQDISVAGKRGGMVEGSETRSSLFFEQVRLWHESAAPYFLWENVPGAFSSNNGRDFAAVLSALVGAPVAVPHDGWRSAGVASGPTGVAAWRVLDAQFFGVPQRRRRVFVLGARAGGVDPADVLSLGEGVRGDFAPRDEAGEGSPADARGGAARGGGADRASGEQCGARGGFSESGAGFWRDGVGPIRAEGENRPSRPSTVVLPIQEIGKRQSGTPQNGVGHGKPGDPMYTLQAGAEHGVIAFDTKGTEVQHEQDITQSMRADAGGQLGVLAYDDRNQKANDAVYHTLRGEQSQFSDHVFDARGNGDGKIAPPITGDHANRVSDYTAIVTTQRGREGGARAELESDLAPALRTPGGGSSQPTVFVMGSGQGNAEIVSDGSPSLTGLHEAPIVFTQQRDAEYADKGVASTLSARDHKEATDIVVAPPITAGAHPGGANGMDAAEHAAAILAVTIGNDSRARSGEVLPAPLRSGERAQQGVFTGRPRRLMPIECERLQGWPDGHTDVPDEKGKRASDSARYKAAGNGIASPVVAWIAFRLKAAILQLRSAAT